MIIKLIAAIINLLIKNKIIKIIKNESFEKLTLIIFLIAIFLKTFNDIINILYSNNNYN